MGDNDNKCVGLNGVRGLKAQVEANVQQLAADINTKERELAQLRLNHAATQGALQALAAVENLPRCERADAPADPNGAA